MTTFNHELTRSMCYGCIERIVRDAEERNDPNALPCISEKVVEYHRKPFTWLNKILPFVERKGALSGQDKACVEIVLSVIDSFCEDKNAPVDETYLLGYRCFDKAMNKVMKAAFGQCYSLSTNAAKLQAVRIAEEIENGKTDRAKELAQEYEAASAEYWRMKDAFKAVGILDEYEEYEDAMLDKHLNK